jgi:ABC-2 type transport system permease protein
MSDALTMTGRGLRLTMRKPDALITAFMLPILIMVVFVYLFGGAISIGTAYVTYVVPGVMVLCAVTGSAPTAVTVCQDMAGGIIDRFRSLNVAGPAIVGGHVVASLVRNVVSTAMLFGVAYAMGFRPDASVGGFLAAIAVLLLFVAAISWLCAALGLLVSSPEAANSSMFLMFIAYASSAFVPVSTMPTWLRGFAANQPVTPITETVRALLLGQPAGSRLWIALVWCCGILLVSAAGSALLFHRRTG